jgi:Xaa-Pro aminopeptidase
MQTLHPVLKRGGLYWDRALLPPVLFEERYKRIQEAIAAAGDDAWLVYGDAQRYGALAYATHYVTRLRSALALIPKSGLPVLLAAVGSRDIPASKVLTWVDDMRPFGRLPASTVELVTGAQLDRAKLGTVGFDDGMPIAEWDAIAAGLPNVRWNRRDAEFTALRPARHLSERNAARKPGAVVERGLMVARHVFKPGLTVRQATALVDREMRREAAEDVRILVASGEQAGVQLRPPDDRMLAQGDVVLLFVAAEVQRYWAEAAQTLVLGPVPPAVRELSAKAARAVGAMETAAKSGAPVKSVAEAARGMLGAGVLWDVANTYGLGHGIGLDSDLPPVISLDSTETIEREVILALHVVLHDGGHGAVAGNTFLIHGKESSELSTHPPLVDGVPK